jgi:hypothetical protein
VSDQLRVTQILRFSSKIGGKLSVTYQNILDAWLLCVSATSGFDLFDLVKINSVVVEVMAADANAVTSAKLAFPGKAVAGLFGDGTQYEAAGIGATKPAKCFARPSKNSTVGQFQTSSSNVAFVIEGTSAGSSNPQMLVEVSCEFRNSSELVPTPTAVTPATGAPGELYFRGLDGQNVATTQWPSLLSPTV